MGVEKFALLWGYGIILVLLIACVIGVWTNSGASTVVNRIGNTHSCGCVYGDEISYTTAPGNFTWAGNRSATGLVGNTAYYVRGTPVLR